MNLDQKQVKTDNIDYCTYDLKSYGESMREQGINKDPVNSMLKPICAIVCVLIVLAIIVSL
jgi:hypothetical protein